MNYSQDRNLKWLVISQSGLFTADDRDNSTLPGDYVDNKYLEAVCTKTGFTVEMLIAYFKHPTWSNKISGLKAGDAPSLFGLTSISS